MTKYESANLSAADGDALLAVELNRLCALFKLESPELATLLHPPAHSDHIPEVEEH